MEKNVNETSIENLFINSRVASNISNIIESTLGPAGMDKMVVIDNDKQLITNDGATILNSLKFLSPVAKIMVEISRSQDLEVGDGTTTVCLFAAELILISKALIMEGLCTKEIIKNFKKAALISVHLLEKLSFRPIDKDFRSLKSLLLSCCATTLNSKLIASKRHIFSRIIVDIALSAGKNFNHNLISVKTIVGGSLSDSFFFFGIGVKKPFSYAGFEKQKKKFYNPKILLLDLELELKTEKTDSEVRVNNILKYKQFVDAEWSIIYEKLDQIVHSNTKVVFSKQSIGDLATQFFSERGIFSGGRIPFNDLLKISKATDAKIFSTLTNFSHTHLGKCGMVEEKQIGEHRYILFSGCLTDAATIILRGNSQRLLEETKRCLNDGIMVVNKVLKNQKVVGGAGSIELKLASKLRHYARTLTGKEQIILGKFAQSLEIIPKILCRNSGLDQLKILSALRTQHEKNESWNGINVENGKILNTKENHIWEPLCVKLNAIQTATEAACMILSIDSVLSD
mmetsp:Transcript_25807/g.51754  ORF Transcript_25807/g.51754 Transcript_25807/m.51754 type:complete len:513 (-) Transcript_25807:174-1712(-)